MLDAERVKEQIIILGGHRNYSRAVAQSITEAGLTPVYADDEQEALNWFRFAEYSRTAGHNVRIVGLVALMPFGNLGYEQSQGARSDDRRQDLSPDPWSDKLTSGFVVGILEGFGRTLEMAEGAASQVIFTGLDVPRLGSLLVDMLRSSSVPSLEQADVH